MLLNEFRGDEKVSSLLSQPTNYSNWIADKVGAFAIMGAAVDPTLIVVATTFGAAIALTNLAPINLGAVLLLISHIGQ